MSDYYELLGIEPEAGKDDIRAAYRDKLEGASQADRAKLNKAWNVLSDPVQRGRYDDARSEGWLDDAEGDDDSGIEVVDRKPSPPARGAARPRPEPTVELPAGMRLADPRTRGTALLIDFMILFVIYMLALTTILPAVLKAQYPSQTKQIDQINSQTNKLDDQKSKQDAIANNSKKTKAQQNAAKAESKKLQKQIDANDTKVKDIAKDFQSFALLLYAALLAIFLAMLVPTTAITGQTLGMRIRKVRVVRLDGSPVGWAGAFGRFVIPISIALLLPQLGALIGLGMVLWFLRDRNAQGFHDKLARTLVVAAD